MQVRTVGILSGMAGKEEILDCIYNVYSGWVASFPVACLKGCSACCTRSVVLTDLEGRVILDFINSMDTAADLHGMLSGATPGENGPAMTMNRFAEACLNQQEIGEEGAAGWDLAPCIFLEQDTCKIYPVRPFGCRSFVSFEKCGRDGAADMSPVLLAVNTVFTQVIEHLSSNGGCCGTMVDMLQALVKKEPVLREPRLLPARPVPGFLLAPNEKKVASLLLQELYKESGNNRIFGDLIDNFMLI